MIYFDDAVSVATTFINNTFSNSDEYDNEMLCMELEQKRWLNFSKGSIEKQVADICEYLTVEAITEAIKRDRLNDYVKEIKANIYGIADMRGEE